MASAIKDIGPCRVVWNNVDLGATYGGVSFQYSQSSVDVKEDQLGDNAVSQIITGQTCTVTAKLTRTSIAVLTAVINGASGSGTSGTGFTVKTLVGEDQLDNAKELVLKPVVGAGGDASSDDDTYLYVYKAAPKVNFNFEYNLSGQRVYEVVFTGFVDRSADKPQGRVWGIKSH